MMTIFVIVTVVLVFAAVIPLVWKIFSSLGNAEKERAQLLRTGVQAEAQILNVQMGGMQVAVHGHRHLGLRLVLAVQAPSHAPYQSGPYQVTADAMISELQIAQVQPGAFAVVRIDPKNPMKVIIEGIRSPMMQGQLIPIMTPSVPAGAKIGALVGIGGGLVGALVAVVVVAVNVDGIGLDSDSKREGDSICAQAIRCCELTAQGDAIKNCKNMGKMGVPEQACKSMLEGSKSFAKMQGKTCR
jgi:hypothetical protein